MKQTNTRLLKYAGSKYDFISLINPEINRSNSSIYIEPFCGSASIFFNLEKDFETYLLNDKDRNVIQIFKSFKTGTYSLLNDIFNFIEKKYGDIKNNKESYYNFRNDFNSKL
jgi:DNA adenine methylase Dam